MQEIWHSVVGYEGLYEVSNMRRLLTMGLVPPSLIDSISTALQGATN